MKPSSYRDHDYMFGQLMLSLRTKMRLTQKQLADLLGVSRRTIGSWEAGSKYPQSENLRQFVMLAVERHVFTPESGVEDIRDLWNASRQKVLLDEDWLNALFTLTPRPDQLSSGISIPSGKSNDVMQADYEDDTGQEADLTYHQASTVTPQTSASRQSETPSPHLDWDEALSISTFFGREWELDILQKWIIEENCRLVSILGLGGIGKSTLAVKLMREVAQDFEVVIWRSLRDIPTCDVLLNSLLQTLGPSALSNTLATLEQRMSILMERLRTTRTLLVLDNLESILGEGQDSGRIKPAYEGFEYFLRLCAETTHRSCVLLTSREKPDALVQHEGIHSLVRALRLSQLDTDACEQLLLNRGIKGSSSEKIQLIEAYAGNPLALKMVTQTILDLFDGQIRSFLDQGEVIFGGIRKLLETQFNRLSATEQNVALWLAIMREPVSIDDLLALQVTPIPRARLLEAIDSLHRRSLIERGQKPGVFTLQSVVMEYVTAILIHEVVSEIESGHFARLIELNLEVAHVHNYLRQNQTRLIIDPILSHLRQFMSHQPSIVNKLVELLNTFKSQSPLAQGYGPANLVTMLRHVQGNLNDLDLSNLSLRGIYLQGVQMQDSSLAGSTMSNCIFSEAFDITTAIAIDKEGICWAASSRRGEIHIWDAATHTLRATWQAHADMIWSIAFSPDENMLATASWDSTIKVFSTSSGDLLWSGHHSSHANRVAYSPDGKLLASGGNDATIRFLGCTNRQTHRNTHTTGCCHSARMEL